MMTLDLANYNLNERIYEGQHTTVFRGSHVLTHQTVIVKILRSEYPSGEEIGRFRHEYELTKKLSKILPLEVVKPLEIIKFENSYAIIFEDIGSMSLDRYLKLGKLNLPQFLQSAKSITEILGLIHANHVLHKDINPSNILIHPNDLSIRLIDFGISTFLSSEWFEAQTIGFIEGTLPYISPEQTGRINRVLDYRSDYYSLGVCLYEMLTGVLPFPSMDKMELVHSHLAKKPIPPHEISPNTPLALSNIIMKLLAKTADDRYQSIYGLIYDLNECQKQLLETGKISFFQIAQKDLSTRFHIAEKLYGREKEITALMETFSQASLGKTCLTLISGAPGVGKSALVNEIHQPIAEKRGFFASGKCDQYKKNVPYEVLLQALQKMVQQINNESATNLSIWKQRFKRAVGAHGKIITDLIPQAKYLLGPQPELQEVGLMESKLRFRTVLQNFIQALIVDDRPLTLFFDDIQWIDEASLELLEYLLCDPQTHHLFIIGAFRNQEIIDDGRLANLLEKLASHHFKFNQIEIPLLNLRSVQELIEDTLHHPVENVAELAKICLDKTAGNPFFLNRLLHSLYQERLIFVNLKTGTWHWDIQKIRSKDITDNVVDFMSQKILQLSEKTQQILQIASCIGNTFDLHILAKVTKKTVQDTTNELWEAIQEGLIIPLNENYKFTGEDFNIRIPYRFLHDRVQQAVYIQIEDLEKQKFHEAIAKTMLGNLSNDQIEESLFEIANHLNQSNLNQNNMEDRTIYAVINLKAGLKAQASSAFPIAAVYMRKAKKYLPENAWETMYPDCLTLFVEFSKCLYSISDHREALFISEEAFKNAKTPLQKADISALQVMYYTETGQIYESLRVGFEGLKLLGLNLHNHPSKLSVIKEFILTKYRQQKMTSEDVINLPKISDSRVKLIFKILDNCDVSAYYAGDKNLVALMAFKKINLTLQYGLSDSTCNSYIAYAVMQVIAGDLKAAYKYGQLALKLAEKTDSKHYKSRVLALYGHMVGGWHQHWGSLKTYLKEAALIARETGDMLTYRLGLTYSLLWDPDMPLDQMVEEGRKVVEIIKQTKSPQAFETSKLQFRMRESLCGQTTSPFLLDDEEFNESECIERMQRNKFYTGLAIFYHNRCILHYHLNDFEKSFEYLGKLDPISDANAGGNFHIEYAIYSFYIHAALYRRLKGFQKLRSWRRLKKQYKLLCAWSIHCPVNFLHHKFLMEAELARLSDDYKNAPRLYEKAIKAARNHEYARFEALANELAAVFYLENGLEKNAKIFLHDARYCFQKWGAYAKVKQLENTYPELLTPLHSNSNKIQTTTTTISERTSADTLDFISVMKASQAITRELHLESLMEKMMQIVIENAGAEVGYLLLEHDGEYIAEAMAKDGIFSILPLNANNSFSKAVIKKVSETKEAVVVDDAFHDNTYKSDLHISHVQSKSILCIPLINLGVIKGMLYLENTLARGVFTQERLDVINMLSTQMAISMDNALFYANLEQKVQERTKELKDTQNKLIEKEKMAFLGMLTTGIGHEMKNPLNFIVNFSRFSSEVIKEILDLIKQFPAKKIDEIPTLLDSLNLVKDNTEAIYQQGRKADTIINRMIEHSTSSRQQFVQTDINSLLEQTLNVSKVRVGELYHDLNVTIETDFDLSMPKVNVVEPDLHKVFLNLLDNAFYTLHQKKGLQIDFNPKIKISTYNMSSHCEIHIQDNGLGITLQDQEKIFTPFFTTRPTGQGVGLGLSLCHNIIVKEHGGTLSFITKPGESTVFVLILPMT